MASEYHNRKISRSASRPSETFKKIAAQNLDGYFFVSIRYRGCLYRQWHEIPRIFESPTYRLDNNEVERINRYISLTRRRMTIGSHTGAESAALYHSLAITCHRCGINVYEYFCDIIDRCAAWPPNTPLEKYRDLLPDRWKPSKK